MRVVITVRARDQSELTRLNEKDATLDTSVEFAGIVYPLTHKHTFARLRLVKSNILSLTAKAAVCVRRVLLVN